MDIDKKISVLEGSQSNSILPKKNSTKLFIFLGFLYF